MLSHAIPGTSQECVGAEIFIMSNKNYLCIVENHSKFPIIKQVKGYSVDNLIRACKIICAEYRLSCKLISDAGTNFISEKFQYFCKCLDTNNVVTSLCNHQNNEKTEACIMFGKQTTKKCVETNN